MKIRTFVSIFAIAAAAVLIAANTGRIPQGDLTVHEWGTFTSVAGQDGAAIEWDALGGKADLPAFVNDFGYRCFKWQLRGTVRMETPVIYFYSPRELDAHVKVSFPRGLITEWYPAADNQILQKGFAGVRRLNANLAGIDTTLGSVTGAMEWNVKIQPGTSPAFLTDATDSHYYAARATDAAPIAVGNQHEKFLFYRGVGRMDVPLSAKVAGDGTVVVRNLGQDVLPSVIYFENRGGRMGFKNVGAVQDRVTLAPLTLNGSVSTLRHDLENALTVAGLFPKEAKAMVETWRNSWFEEGSRLIYIVPSRTVDAALPLQIDPSPATVARVFVGRMELFTAETMRSVESAIAKGDSKTIDAYGRFLPPILARLGSENPNRQDELTKVRWAAYQRAGISCPQR